MSRLRKVFALCFPFFLFSYEGPPEGTGPIKPWFTGPILGGSGNTVPAGHTNFEPYVFAFANTSFYNNDWSSKSIETLWNLQFRTPLWVGVFDWMDLKLVPVWHWNYRDGQSQWTVGDLSAQVNFQLHRDRPSNKSWLPSMKLSIREIFPTGKYEHLNPKKLGTDGGGRGSYTTVFALSFSKVFHLEQFHFLNLMLNLVYFQPTKVHVKGFNAYGGGFGTKGVVDPDKIGLVNFAFEYALTRNWVVTCDFEGVWTTKIDFSGKLGAIPADDSDIDPNDLPANNQRKASIRYSMAPAIEYNWSSNLGLIAGVWFTVAGKNTSRFTTGVIALNYYR